MQQVPSLQIQVGGILLQGQVGNFYELTNIIQVAFVNFQETVTIKIIGIGTIFEVRSVIGGRNDSIFYM